jgi:predicted acylesterase/phospholipase RssA
MAGGGSLGAYQVGLLKGFIENSNSTDYEYDYISGDSAGALNALAMGMFAKGNETAMVETVLSFWSNIKDDSTIFSINPFPKSLWAYPSLTSNEPLRKYVTNMVEQYGPLKRNLDIGSTDFDTGQHVILNETNTLENLVECVICSSAIPGFFPY